MDRLPVEILQEIGQNLCFHCQNPGVFVNADLPEARQDKRALARLSAISRGCRYALQPILFHYYATEDFKLTDKDWRFTTESCSNDDKLPKFLWALIHRPDLARQVKYLQILDRLDAHKLDQELIAAFDDDAKAYSLVQQTPSFRHSHSGASIHSQQDLGHGHRWAKQLVLSLCTFVESLLILHISPTAILENPNVSLSSLTTLCLANQDSTSSVQETGAVIAATSSLRTLYLFTNTTPTSFRQPVAWNFEDNALQALSGLRKLVIEGPEPIDLGRILSHCHELEELEFYKIENYHFWNVEDMMRALAPVKDTLRRLSFSFLPRTIKAPPERVDLMTLESKLWSSYPTNAITSLREFTQLEELGLDQASMYCPDIRDDELLNSHLLLSLLPPRIRKLRLSYVYRGMAGDLRSLARRGPTEFPDLRQVVIGVTDQVAERRRLGIAETTFAVKKLTAAGYEVSLETDRVGADPQTRAGSFTGAEKEMIPCPCV